MSPRPCVPVVGVDVVRSTVPSSASSAPLVNVDPKSTARIVMRPGAGPVSAVDVEGLAQVGDEVVDVLDADREPDEV